MLNQQLKIIAEISAIINANPEDCFPRYSLHIWSLCDQLEKLATTPLHAEIERLEAIIREHNKKPIPNLNDLNNHYESVVHKDKSCNAHYKNTIS
jgi:hypothetical protein